MSARSKNPNETRRRKQPITVHVIMVLRLSPVKCINNGGKQATDGKSDIDRSRNNARFTRENELLIFPRFPRFEYRCNGVSSPRKTGLGRKIEIEPSGRVIVQLYPSFSHEVQMKIGITIVTEDEVFEYKELETGWKSRGGRRTLIDGIFVLFRRS